MVRPHHLFGYKPSDDMVAPAFTEANLWQPLSPPDGGKCLGDATDPRRAERCLRMLLSWVGAPREERQLAEVLKVVNELLDSDRAGVQAALRRLAGTLATDELLRDRYRVTAREADVARLLALGKSNAEIATALGISEHTSRRHTEQVLAKLGVRSRAAVAAAMGLAGADGWHSAA